MQNEKKRANKSGRILSILLLTLFAFGLRFQTLRANSEEVNREPLAAVAVTQFPISSTAEEITKEILDPTETEEQQVEEPEEAGPQFDENISCIPEILRISSIDLDANILPIEQEIVVVDYVIYLQ